MPVAFDIQADILLESIRVVRGGKEIIHTTDARLRRGKTTVIMGASGCGKSTFLKVSAGITLPDGGSVKLGEKDIHSLPEREETILRKDWGFVFQDAALWANKTILQNLTLPLLYHEAGLSTAEAEMKAEKLARSVGYRDEMNLRPSQLSTGEMKMISFARALISEPSVLFLDSPFLSVDYSSVERMRKILADFRNRGGTICAIFQEPKYIAQTADELIIMKDGMVIGSGALADIINTADREIYGEIGELLDQAASYDGSILDILSDSESNPFDNNPGAR